MLYRDANNSLPKYSRMPSKFSSDVTSKVFKIYFRATSQVNGFWLNSFKKFINSFRKKCIQISITRYSFFFNKNNKVKGKHPWTNVCLLSKLFTRSCQSNRRNLQISHGFCQLTYLKMGWISAKSKPHVITNVKITASRVLWETLLCLSLLQR